MPAPRPEQRGGHPIHRGWAGAALIYLVCAASLSFPWLSGGVTIPWDAKAHFYPQLQFLAHSLHSAQSPFWNPYVFAGSPQIADPQSLIFSPPFLLLAALNADPSFIAADAVVFIMLALGGLATLVFFKDRGWDASGGLVAALALTFGGSAAWRIQHIGEVLSLMWMIIALTALGRCLTRVSFVYAVGFGCCAAFMLLGRDQIAFLGAFVLAAYAVGLIMLSARPLIALRRLAPALAAATAVIALIIAYPLALTYALSQDSNRAVIDLAGAERGSLHPSSLSTLFVANLFGTDGPLDRFWGAPSFLWGETDLFLARNMGALYMGAVPVCGVILAMGSGVARTRAAALLASGCVLALIYALGRYTPAFQFMFKVPGVDLFRRPADASFIFCALTALLAGYCVHLLMQDPASPTRRAVAISALTAAMIWLSACALAALKGQLSAAWPPLLLAALLAAGAFAVILCSRRLNASAPFAAQLMLAGFMAFDLSVNNGPNESTALAPATYDSLRTGTRNETIRLLKSRLAAETAPDRRDRVELAAIGFHWPNASLSHRMDHDLGYNPVRLKLFTDATGAGDHVALASQRQFSRLAPSYSSPLYQLMGLRFIAAGVPISDIDPALRGKEPPLIGRTPDAFVYENAGALPRVLLTAKAVSADFNALLAGALWPDVDFREVVLIDRSDIARLPAIATGSSARQAKILRYENTSVLVEVSAAEGGYLVLNDIWHPWWTARVDGAPAEIIRANVMFRAVYLPPGARRVEFVFAPFSGLIRQWAGVGAR